MSAHTPRGELAEARSRADAAARDASSLRERLSALEAQYDELRLVNVALWEILKDRLELSDEELLAVVAQIDARTTKREGRHAREARSCSACSRPLQSQKSVCIYCGAPVARTSPFDGT